MKVFYAVAALALVSACQAKQDAPAAAPVDTAAVTSDAAVKSDAAGAAAPATDMKTMPTAAVQGADADAAVKTRKDNFAKMGKAMKVLSREAKAGAPDMAAVKAASADMVAASGDLPSWFMPGTAVGVAKSEAKPGIWEKADDFTTKAGNFRTAALATDKAAQAGDAAAFKASMEKLGGSCKACHDPYRVKD